MSLTLLHEGINEATQALDTDERDLRRVHELLDPEIVNLGTVHDDMGTPYLALNGFTRSLDPEFPDKCHGGNRMDNDFASEEAARDELRALTIEMALKMLLLRRLWGGRKGLIIAPGRQLEFKTRKSMIAEFAGLMWGQGYAGHDKHVVSGDANTAGTSGTYALSYHDYEPNDRLWQASACGKEAHLGGIPTVRRSATSRGVIRGTETHMKLTGRERADIVIKGLGQVGAWAANEALSSDLDLRVTAVGDMGGSLWTKHPRGIMLTDDIVDSYGDNPAFRGDKIQAIRAAHETAFPDVPLLFDQDPYACYMAEADYALSCVLRDDITLNIAKRMPLRVGAGEGGNNVTTMDAERYLLETGRIVLPDIALNNTGVGGSILEWDKTVNPETALTETADMQARLDNDQETSIGEVIRFAQEHQIASYRVASIAIALRRLLAADRARQTA